MDVKSPLKGAWSASHNPFLISMPAIISPERAEAIVTKVYLQVEYISSSSLWMTDYPLMDVVRVT